MIGVGSLVFDGVRIMDGLVGLGYRDLTFVLCGNFEALGSI